MMSTLRAAKSEVRYSIIRGMLDLFDRLSDAESGIHNIIPNKSYDFHLAMQYISNIDPNICHITSRISSKEFTVSVTKEMFLEFKNMFDMLLNCEGVFNRIGDDISVECFDVDEARKIMEHFYSMCKLGLATGYKHDVPMNYVRLFA